MYKEDLRIANYVFNKKYLKLQEEKEDIISMCVLELWKKRQVFDPQRAKWITFAVLTCNHIILRHIRYLKAQKRNGKTCSLYEELPNSNGLTVADMLGKPDDYDFEATYIKKILAKTFKEIKDERTKKAISLYYNGSTQRDIAEAIGVSQAHVSRKLRKFKDICKAEIDRQTA